MRIANNLMAMNAHRQLVVNQGGIAKSIEKLSSGLRINRAGDDAAGLAISEKMRGQIRGLKQAMRNAQDGISLIQTAEGALQETHAILQRMRELVVQSNNGTNTDDDLDEIQKELDQLTAEIDRIARRTEFNTKTLLDGSLGVKAADGSVAIDALTSAGIRVDVSGVAPEETLTFQLDTLDPNNKSITVVGTNSGISQKISIDPTTIKAGTTLHFDALGVSLSFGKDVDLTDLTDLTNYGASDSSLDNKSITTTGTKLSFQIGPNANTTLDISIDAMDSSSLGSASLKLDGVNVRTQTFEANLKAIDEAIKQVSAQRSQLGAWQNRLEHTIANLGVSAENLQAAESRIRDVDMAQEMMNFTKFQILQQASTAMLAQANLAPQSVLQLLG